MRRIGTGLVVLLAIALLAGLPGKGFWGAHGEARRAEVAREIHQSGEWLVPTLVGEPFVTKPPLLYWAEASSFVLTGGVSEFRARIPSVLATVGTLLLVLGLARRLEERRRAGTARAGGVDRVAAAGILFASTPLVIEMGRNAETEPLLLFFATLSVYAFASIPPGTPSLGSLRWRLVLALALAGGFMVKGPLGWFFPLIGIASLELLSARGEHRFRWTDAALFCVTHAVLVVPWFLAVAHRVPGAWDVWFGESVARVTDPGFRTHREPFWYYLPALGSFAPWVLLLPAALAGFPAALRARETPRTWPLVWLTAGIVFLSMATSKRAHYMLSLAPALVLAVAPYAASELQDGFLARWGRRLIRILAWALPPALLLALGYLQALGTGPGAARVLPAGLAAVALLAVLFCLRGARLALFAGLSFALAMAVAGFALTPSLDAYRSPRSFYEDADTLIPDGDRVANWRNDRFSASFYLRRHVPQLETLEQLETELPDGGWLLCEEQEVAVLGRGAERRLRSELRDPFRPGRTKVWVLVRWTPGTDPPGPTSK